MAKVCILSTVDLSRMTMVSVYTDYFEKNNIKYDIIYVDKYKDESPFKAENLYAYNADEYKDSSFPVKLAHYWKMRNYVKDIISRENYSFAVVWGELAAFIFADILAKMMPKRYCLNIRDYFYNNVFIVKSRMKIAVSGAAFCTVSSGAYLKFLPKNGKYIMMHSLNHKIIDELKPITQLRQKDKPLRILYIGLIARLPYAYKLIDELGNDDRFQLIFAGIGSENIDSYIEGKNYNNIVTYGRFPQSDTAKYLEDADIIYNLYGYGNRHFDTALSIKLYYSIFLHKPIMVFEGTETKAAAEECCLAFVLNKDDYNNIGNRLYDWYYSLDLEDVSKKCDDYLKKVNESHEELFKQVNKVLNITETEGENI